MTAFECDEPADFMHLMLRLRARGVRLYRAGYADLRRPARDDSEALSALDGASSRVELAPRPRCAGRAMCATWRTRSAEHADEHEHLQAVRAVPVHAEIGDRERCGAVEDDARPHGQAEISSRRSRQMR